MLSRMSSSSRSVVYPNGCVPRPTQITARTGQPLKIFFLNEDATDHNLVFVKPEALEEVGMAANEMAKSPKNANSDFIPQSRTTTDNDSCADDWLDTQKPSACPAVSGTNPARTVSVRLHISGTSGNHERQLEVGKTDEDAKALLASHKPTMIKERKMSDFEKDVVTNHDEKSVMRGMQAFVKARCHQRHQIAGHGVNLGPDLAKVNKRFKGRKLL